MQLTSDYVGTLLKEYRKEITWPISEIRIQMVGREAGSDGDHLFFHVLNHEGKKAISEGVITRQAS